MDFKCDELILGKKDADSRALTVYYVTGPYDLMVVVTAANAAEYGKFSQELMGKVPQIRRITTQVVIDAPKRSFYVPIRSIFEE